MNSFLASVLLVSSVSCLPGGGYYRHGYGGGYGRVQPKAATQNIAELVSTNPKFSTLLAAVKAAGLVDTLASEGPFTVFAPTNAAFAKIPAEALQGVLADKEALTAILLRHVVAGSALASKDIPNGSTNVETAGGEEITVTKGKYVNIQSSAGKANVVIFDVKASNGVVHAVDTVF